MFSKYLSTYIMHGAPLTCYMPVNDVPYTCNGRGNSVNYHDVTYSEIFLSFQHFVCEAVMVFLTQRFSYLFSTLFVVPSWCSLFRDFLIFSALRCEAVMKFIFIICPWTSSFSSWPSFLICPSVRLLTWGNISACLNNKAKL